MGTISASKRLGSNLFILIALSLIPLSAQACKFCTRPGSAGAGDYSISPTAPTNGGAGGSKVLAAAKPVTALDDKYFEKIKGQGEGPAAESAPAEGQSQSSGRNPKRFEVEQDTYQPQ